MPPTADAKAPLLPCSIAEIRQKVGEGEVWIMKIDQIKNVEIVF